MQKKAEYAGFWIRLAAYLIDALAMGAISIALAFAGALVAAAQGASSETQFVVGALIFFMGRYPIGALYFAVMESSPNQATLGKMALGLKVTKTSGERISFLRALWRVFVKMVSGIFTNGLVFLVVALDKKKQGLHDHMAKTLVMKSR